MAPKRVNNGKSTKQALKRKSLPKRSTSYSSDDENFDDEKIEPSMKRKASAEPSTSYQFSENITNKKTKASSSIKLSSSTDSYDDSDEQESIPTSATIAEKTSGHNSQTQKRKSQSINEESHKKTKIHAKENDTSISHINTFQSNWKILAKVISKTHINNWTKNGKTGKVFNMVLQGNDGQIRVSAFNENVDKFYEKIQVNKNYYFSKANVIDANKKYSTIKNNYEIMLTNDSEIEECKDRNIVFPEIELIFEPIDKISSLPIGSIFNINAICYEVKGLQHIIAKSNGKEYVKRDIVLIDLSNATITLTLWNDYAENFDTDKVRDVITLTNVRLTEYNSKKSIALSRDSEITINENTQKAKSLKEWFESKNHTLLSNIVSKNEMDGVEISSIENLHTILPLTTVNVMGVCFDIGELINFPNEKSNTDLRKREITLVDKSIKPIKLVLWNDEAIEFEKKFTDSVISIKNIQIIEKAGKKLLTNTNETIILHSPDIPESHDLQNWYQNEGKKAVIQFVTSLALNGL